MPKLSKAERMQQERHLLADMHRPAAQQSAAQQPPAAAPPESDEAGLGASVLSLFRESIGGIAEQLQNTTRHVGLTIQTHTMSAAVRNVQQKKEWVTPLLWATVNATRGKLDNLQALIDSNADVSATPSGTISPLVLACTQSEADVRSIQLLLDAAADPNQGSCGAHSSGREQYTPLHMACLVEGNVPVIKLLLERGADASAVLAASGATKLQLSKGFQPEEMARTTANEPAVQCMQAWGKLTTRQQAAIHLIGFEQYQMPDWSVENHASYSPYLRRRVVATMMSLMASQTEHCVATMQICELIAPCMDQHIRPVADLEGQRPAPVAEAYPSLCELVIIELRNQAAAPGNTRLQDAARAISDDMGNGVVTDARLTAVMQMKLATIIVHRLIEREGVSSYAVGVDQRLKIRTDIDVIDPTHKALNSSIALNIPAHKLIGEHLDIWHSMRLFTVCFSCVPRVG